VNPLDWSRKEGEVGFGEGGFEESVVMASSSLGLAEKGMGDKENAGLNEGDWRECCFDSGSDLDSCLPLGVITPPKALDEVGVGVVVGRVNFGISSIDVGGVGVDVEVRVDEVVETAEKVGSGCVCEIGASTEHLVKRELF